MAERRPPLDIARELAQYGFNVLPARPGGKAPIFAWQKYQTQRTDDMLPAWFGTTGSSNYWVPTGRISGIVVLDCDNEAAEVYWRDLLGADVLDTTTRVATRKGHHYYFRIERDEALNSWSRHDSVSGADAGVEFDVRADGTGVIVPPSVHETGHTYTWEVGPDAMLPLPDELRGGAGDGTGGTGGNTRSMLAALLNDPQKQGGRNDWMARVAGHYAKEYRDRRDAYEVHCRMAGQMLQPPLDEAEFTKTIESIWKKEQTKAATGAANPAEENGWLMAGHHCLMTYIKVRDPDTGATKTDLARWADFDIRALGVVDDPEADRVYDVEVLRERHNDSRRALLPARKLSDPRSLVAWLAEFGVTILPPESTWPKTGSISSRLGRYLESQAPPHFQVVHALGWDGTGFVTHEGVIRSDGLHGHEGRKPDPQRRDWAPYHYGFTDEATAKAVLREVLTFHDETVTAVFGAWWAACLIRPQLTEVTSLFPFMALEAPSESGKTSGFFALMLQLGGNTQGNVNPTWAALRDNLSAHRSGIVWIDDLNDPERLMELLRQATGDGSVSKKGEDRHSTETVQLVAPICISGEALNLGGQKALLDRAVMLDVPSPTGRRSLHDPDRPQWDDIVELRKRFGGDLTAVAGNMVMLALRSAERVRAEVPLLLPDGGRWGEKIAILRAGARLLTAMTDDDTWIERVDTWCNEQEPTGQDNTLTLKLIPAALAQYNWPDRPKAASNERMPQTPAFIARGKDGYDYVWFNPAALANWWFQYRSGRVEVRTETADALTQQAKAMGLGGGGASARGNRTRAENRKRWRLESEVGAPESFYWRLDVDSSRDAVARSRGVPGGVLRTGSPGSSGSAERRLDLPAYFDLMDALGGNTEPGNNGLSTPETGKNPHAGSTVDP